MIEVRNITHQFDGLTVVNDASFYLKEGEFFSLLGPSGCGKTTLLRILAGFIKSNQGKILFDDKPIHHLPPQKRHFNMVFQKYALFPHLSVFENVAFGLRMSKRSNKVAEPEIQSRTIEALKLVQMDSMARRLPTTLSGGQQQRVALARALINRPRLLLLDEPLSALDLKLRQQMQMELHALQRRLKTTFVFVTHDQEEALTLSDRVAVMSAGRIEQIGTPSEIYNTPKTRFAARFIGSMNELPSGEMIRPEKIRFSKTPLKGESARSEAIIRDLFYQGPITRILVEASSFPGALIEITRPNTGDVGPNHWGVADSGHIYWNEEDILRLPKES